MNKETYISRRAKLKKDMGSGLLLFLGNDEAGIYFIPELMDKWRAEHLHEDFICYDALDAWRDFTGLRNEMLETFARLMLTIGLEAHVEASFHLELRPDIDTSTEAEIGVKYGRDINADSCCTDTNAYSHMTKSLLTIILRRSDSDDGCHHDNGQKPFHQQMNLIRTQRSSALSGRG